MRSAVVLLERSSVIPKSVWRSSTGSRRFTTVEVSQVIAGTWKSHRQQVEAEAAVIVVPLQLDGSAKEAPRICAIQGGQKAYIGVFDVSFVSTELVKVTLREEECGRRLGLPSRPTREIALLRPWRPVRVLLNGRSASYSGQYYQLLEYHMVLCAGAVPEQLEPTRFVDLQADLF